MPQVAVSARSKQPYSITSSARASTVAGRSRPSAFETANKLRVDALIVALDGLTQANRGLIIELASTYRLPAIYGSGEFVYSGGLLTYTTDFPDLCYRAATYVDKILKGSKASDLPVQQSDKFALVINLKTAKALGITVPPSVLARADEVIE